VVRDSEYANLAIGRQRPLDPPAVNLCGFLAGDEAGVNRVLEHDETVLKQGGAETSVLPAVLGIVHGEIEHGEEPHGTVSGEVNTSSNHFAFQPE
jgi:hypothetical protein